MQKTKEQTNKYFAICNWIPYSTVGGMWNQCISSERLSRNKKRMKLRLSSEKFVHWSQNAAATHRKI